MAVIFACIIKNSGEESIIPGEPATLIQIWSIWIRWLCYNPGWCKSRQLIFTRMISKSTDSKRQIPIYRFYCNTLTVIWHFLWLIIHYIYMWKFSDFWWQKLFSHTEKKQLKITKKYTWQLNACSTIMWLVEWMFNCQVCFFVFYR